MRKVNGMRAQILFDHFKTETGQSVATNFTHMVNTVLKMPSYTEEKCCTGEIDEFPIIFLSSETFQDNFANICDSIYDKFPTTTNCPNCDQFPAIKRSFRTHLLIEVRYYFIPVLLLSDFYLFHNDETIFFHFSSDFLV